MTRSIEPGKVAALCVKNGIGYGHLRRAMLIAQALQEHSELCPVIISQARSAALLRDVGVPVLNFPRLNRVSSALAEDMYWEILDQTMKRLRPAVVVEDTFPDSRLSDLGSLAGVPRVLVSRRLDPVTFERMLANGSLRGFERIVVCQRPDQFAGEPHSAWTRTVVARSNMFDFVGPVWRRASEDERRSVRGRYARPGQKLCVVASGAGGDKYADGFIRRLLHGAHSAARTLRMQGDGWSIAIILGPYAPPIDIPPAAGVALRFWEPDLPALLASADVVVVKPGTNTLLEALDGDAQIVLVPDRAYGEGLVEYSRSLARQPGIWLATADEASIRRALAHAVDAVRQGGSQRLSAPKPATVEVAEIVAGTANLKPRPPEWRFFCGLRIRTAATRPGDGTGGLAIALNDDADLSGNTLPKDCFLLLDDHPASDLRPTELIERGLRLFAVSSPNLYEPIAQWLRKRDIAPDLHLVVAPVFAFTPDAGDRLVRWLLRRLASGTSYTAAVIECDGSAAVLTKLSDILLSLQAAGVVIESLTSLDFVLARTALEGATDHDH